MGAAAAGGQDFVAAIGRSAPLAGAKADEEQIQYRHQLEMWLRVLGKIMSEMTPYVQGILNL